MSLRNEVAIMKIPIRFATSTLALLLRFDYALAVSAAIRVILTKISNVAESPSSGMGVLAFYIELSVKSLGMGLHLTFLNCNPRFFSFFLKGKMIVHAIKTKFKIFNARFSNI